MRATVEAMPISRSPTLGTPDEDITTIIDVTEHLPTRWAAIRAHASQASPYDDLPPELALDFLGHDRLRLVRGAPADL